MKATDGTRARGIALAVKTSGRTGLRTFYASLPDGDEEELAAMEEHLRGMLWDVGIQEGEQVVIRSSVAGAVEERVMTWQ